MQEQQIPLFDGDILHINKNFATVSFGGVRKVISTAFFGGGIREDLTHIFNSDSSMCQTTVSLMKAPTISEHMEIVAKELGLNPKTSVGMCTAAQMENMAIVKKTYKDLEVIAAVTAGIEKNSGRCGDNASWYEEKGNITMISGTINIMVFINGKLDDGCLASALMTVSEARTTAVGELLLGSVYSHGIATGSGTDKAIVVSMANCQRVYTDAGKHSKLGELIGKTCIEAVKQSLFLQTKVCPEFQHNIIRRLSRYGVSKHSLHYKVLEIDYISPQRYDELLDMLNQDSQSVITASLLAHVLDQIDWQLFSINSAIEYIENLTGLKFKSTQTKDDFFNNSGDIILMYFAKEIHKLNKKKGGI